MFYHCSPTGGLTVLEPRKPEHFEKPAQVYLTTSLPMALFYGIRHFEYTYGYTRNGQLYFEEYFPNALEELYCGRAASLYLCQPQAVETTQIPNEAVSAQPVPVLEERFIPDLMEALLEQERSGALVIRRFEGLTQRELDWIRDAEAGEILKRGLLRTDSPMARWMRSHYPESWEMALQSPSTWISSSQAKP